MSRRDRLRLTVLTGFLGSGKTTLLRRALSAGPRERFAVVVNEVAECGIDAELIAQDCAAVMDVSGGCACCERKGEFVAALRKILDGRDAGVLSGLQNVIVETSGLADPLPIVEAVASDPVLRHHFDVQSVVAVVDAMEGLELLDRQPQVRRQVLSADRILISKTDLCPPDGVSALRARLAELQVVAQVELTAQAWRDLLQTAAVHRPSVAGERSLEPPHGHVNGISSLSIAFDRSVDWIAFGVWLSLLLHTHGARVLRVKGVVPTNGLGAISVNAVRHMLYRPEHVAGVRDEGTRLIVVAQGLDTDSIRRSLQAFQRIA